MRNPTSFLGYYVTISTDRANYVLPEEVLPGVPWPVGFRDEINAWARDYLGTYNLLRDGEVYTLNEKELCMNPRTFSNFKRAIEATK